MGLKISKRIERMKPVLKDRFRAFRALRTSAGIFNKKGFGGFGFVGDMVLVMVVLAILLYIIYYFFWDKLIEGSLTPLADNVTKTSQQTGDLIGGIVQK